MASGLHVKRDEQKSSLKSVEAFELNFDYDEKTKKTYDICVVPN